MDKCKPIYISLLGLENAYLFFIVERYSLKLKQQMIAIKKIYCIDNGLANALSFKITENYSSLMENLVATELLRRKSYWQNSLEIFIGKITDRIKLISS
ncbi:MAG: DUF4143 domain-containing protein [Nitrososphaeria archaeon]